MYKKIITGIPPTYILYNLIDSFALVIEEDLTHTKSQGLACLWLLHTNP